MIDRFFSRTDFSAGDDQDAVIFNRGGDGINVRVHDAILRNRQTPFVWHGKTTSTERSRVKGRALSARLAQPLTR